MREREKNIPEDEINKKGEEITEKNENLEKKEIEVDSSQEEREEDEKIEKIREEIDKINYDHENETPQDIKDKPPVQESIKPEGLAQKLQKDRLNVLVENARHILGEKASNQEVKNLSRETFREYIKAIFFSAKPRSKEKLMKQTEISGKEELGRALEENNKAIVVTSHMAYFPTAMKMIPELMPEKTRGNTLVEKNPLWPLIKVGKKIGELFKGDDPKAKKFDMLVKDSKNPRTLLSIIKRLKKASPEQKEMLFMAADRGDLSPDRRKTKVNFFDTKVNFPTGPATISEHTDAPILPTYVVREGDKFKIKIGETIKRNTDLSSEEANNEIMQKVADFFEQGIREHPEQWPMYRHDYWPGQKDYKD
ncbi:MAG: hypothetical protein U5L76_00885 [Patescibacteria group bacterium]|nr:hypothetical protein [Patescibacteria group bacterium]